MKLAFEWRITYLTSEHFYYSIKSTPTTGRPIALITRLGSGNRSKKHRFSTSPRVFLVWSGAVASIEFKVFELIGFFRAKTKNRDEKPQKQQPLPIIDGFKLIWDLEELGKTFRNLIFYWIEK